MELQAEMFREQHNQTLAIIGANTTITAVLLGAFQLLWRGGSAGCVADDVVPVGRPRRSRTTVANVPAVAVSADR